MSNIFVIVIVAIVAMVSISRYFVFMEKCTDKRIRINFLILSFAITMCAVLLIAMKFTYGTRLCFILYALDKFFKAIIMGYVIFLTQDIIGLDSKYTSLFISIMAYGTVALFVIDSIFQGGNLEIGLFGVFLVPKYAWVKLIYLVYYMLYDIVLMVYIIYRASVVFKNCHKHELLLLFIVYSFSAVGFSLEVFNMLHGTFYFPFAIVFNLIALLHMKILLEYHEAISIERRVFSKELDPARLDITFVIDDEMNIIYQNKRAEVMGQIVDDEYIGRKLSEVFELTDSAYGQINATPDEIPFGITADYNPNNHRVNMVIQHKLDNFGEILASVVYVYNMEDEVKRVETSQDVKEDEGKITDNVLSITRGARALIIDDDVVFSNIMTRLLKQYEVSVERAFGDKEGVEQVSNNVYDIIFVAYEMNRIKGSETVRKIRSMVGEYYKQVTIVYLLQSDVNDVFDSIIDTGFNDYLQKPINAKSLSLVLTRWLWQRFDNASTAKAEASYTINNHFSEMVRLLEAADRMLDKENYDNFSYAIRGIFKCALRVGMIDMAISLERLQQSVLLKNTAEITRLYSLVSKEIRDITTI